MPFKNSHINAWVIAEALPKARCYLDAWKPSWVSLCCHHCQNRVLILETDRFYAEKYEEPAEHTNYFLDWYSEGIHLWEGIQLWDLQHPLPAKLFSKSRKDIQQVSPVWQAGLLGSSINCIAYLGLLMGKQDIVSCWASCSIKSTNSVNLKLQQVQAGQAVCHNLNVHMVMFGLAQSCHHHSPHSCSDAEHCLKNVLSSF